MSQNTGSQEGKNNDIKNSNTPHNSSKRTKIITGFLAIILIIGLIIGIYYYAQHAQQKRIGESIIKILESGEHSRKNCSDIYSFDVDNKKYLPDNFNISIYSAFRSSCDAKFDIANLQLNKESCSDLIASNYKEIQKYYLKTQSFEEKQRLCREKFLSVSFSTGSLFQMKNDFKSSINLRFGQEFYQDLKNASDEEFLEHRIAEKKRLLELIQVEPHIDISADDVVLYPKHAQLILSISPESTYTFSMEEFDSDIEGEPVKTKDFTLKTPRFSYFGIQKNKSISLYSDRDLPNFELISYNDSRSFARIKLCRIPNESYAKIEIFEERDAGEEQKKFFTTDIDSLKTYTCFEKDVELSQDKNLLNKISFNFDSDLGTPARSGLYYVNFVNSKDRVSGDSVFTTEFFGIVDSHITMKLSKNGEAFFFVNDLDGKALADQEVRVYIDDFESFNKKYNSNEGKYDVNYHSPLKNEVLGKPIILGTTGKDGVLRVNMKDSVDDYFERTFESFQYDWEGKYKSFFVTSASDTNLSYLSSKWNGGISGWNFGYDVGNGWWYGESENINAIELDRWEQEEPEYYAHIFPDRRLYLPGEKVHIKSIIRNSKDLSLPVGEELSLEITSPDGKNYLTEDIEVGEFGSYNLSVEIGVNDSLGAYQVHLKKDSKVVARSGFNVEIFKNPKFKNEVMLETRGLNNELVEDISQKETQTKWGYKRKEFSAEFSVTASIHSKYYSGPSVKNADFQYKVYKQRYYGDEYWKDCYYGCYWEPEKEFYTEGKGKLDDKGKAQVSIPIEFTSYYDDYKFIVEVSVTDAVGDTIAGSNSVIARLPDTLKRWNPESSIYFETDKRFYKAGESFDIRGGLTHGDFSKDYNDQFLLIIKKKDYFTRYVKDVRGYERPVTRSEERIQKILSVNTENFNLSDGKLSYNYTLPETGEYILEYGAVNKHFFSTARKGVDNQILFNEILSELRNGQTDFVDIGTQEFYKFDADYETLEYLSQTCVGSTSSCSRDAIRKQIRCEFKKQDNELKEEKVEDECSKQGETFSMQQQIGVDDILNSNSKKYTTLIAYGDSSAKNPTQSDNKITVLSEKVSYKLGEKARILVRLPYENGKILWTIEKQGVLHHEYIDVVGNTFFKEIVIDDTFVPNAYIGVVVVDTNHETIPQYKVGYSEIVVDKTEKKSDITLKTDKKTYKTREKIHLEIDVDHAGKNSPSEVTVMVIDDSLISLMGNIDGNILEKMYRKLPFQIQTAITNIAMLKNYYFSRRGIVGGSGFGNFKGGDSAVSSRNIFKNTAYYNANIITDASGKANIEFHLPDNLTNFRIIAIGQTKDNFFGYAETMIHVRQDVIVEDKTPLVLRVGDEIELGANIMNTTQDEIGFLVSFDAPKLSKTSEKKITLKGGENTFVSWKVSNSLDCPKLETCKIPYTISVLGDSKERSDKIENTISLASVPSITTGKHETLLLKSGEQKELSYQLPENVVKKKSYLELAISNNPLRGMAKIAQSLAVYPYGCGEQLMSSTYPNVILKKFDSFIDTGVSEVELQKNIDHGVSEIFKLQLEDGGIAYWSGDSSSNPQISAYALRIFSLMQESGVKLDSAKVQAIADYLVTNFSELGGLERSETLWALSKYYGDSVHEKLKIEDFTQGLDVSLLKRHEKIAFVSALVASNPQKYKNTIQEQIPQMEEVLNNDSLNSWYYNSLSDTASFVQILIALGGYDNTVTKYIQDLSKNNWESYWYSTRSKNEAFLAFADYIESYGSEKQSNIKIVLNGKEQTIQLDGSTLWEKSLSYSDVFNNSDSSSISVTHVSGDPILLSSKMDTYTANPYKLEPYSHDLKISRNIYEVVDPNNMSEKCRWNNGNKECDIPAGLKLVEGNTFKKGADYKIVLEAKFDLRKERQNFVFEDYLPSGFLTLNDNFQTNSIATSQESTGDSWTWSHSEKRPEVMMAHAKSIWGDRARYEYFVRAEFAGEYMYPPFVAYLMYDPEIRASTMFERVEIQ